MLKIRATAKENRDKPRQEKRDHDYFKSNDVRGNDYLKSNDVRGSKGPLSDRQNSNLGLRLKNWVV